ncbi:hypothetical protein [Nocardiopsis sp. CC223A]|uniref:hypothetical protein n=1 Tax=Nocardiopsis sp. CC223A TaxID=3044051 RepID=UPI002795B13E|nr:hypothetical protein [Nocardiopsis sp. CC223A]
MASDGLRGRDGARGVVRSVCVLLALPLLVSCGGETSGDGDTEPAERTVVTLTWMEREVSVETLNRMFAETGSEEVLGNTDERSQDVLLESKVVRPVENGEGHEVVLDKDQWDIDAIGRLNRLDAALGGAMWPNEVTWCGDPVDGETFVNAYTEEFEDVFDTHEEYEGSIADYVDCGDGRP